jgi:hypothetical protein
MVNFSGGTVPSQTAGYVALDGWKQTRLFAIKSQVEDYAGNVINRTGAGAAVRYSGTLNVPAGTVPASLKPGDTISLQPITNGEGTGTAIIACVESAPISGNRDQTEVQISFIKEASMTYTV